MNFLFNSKLKKNLRDSSEQSLEKDQFAVSSKGDFSPQDTETGGFPTLNLPLKASENWSSSTFRYEESLKLPLNDFNNFLLSNSPINLSPYNSDHEDDEELDLNFASTSFQQNSFLPTLRSEKSLNFIPRSTENWSCPTLRSDESLKSSTPTGSQESSSLSTEQLEESLNIFSEDHFDSTSFSQNSFSPTLHSGENVKSSLNSVKKLRNSSEQIVEKDTFTVACKEKCKNINFVSSDASEKNINLPSLRSGESGYIISSKEVFPKKYNKKRRFTKLTYENVENIVSKYYLQNKTSNQFDVLITYLQSKKNIYIQSQNLLQIYLTIINVLTLVLTASVAIFAPFMYNYTWSSYFISAVNSMIAILIKLKDGLKYESNIENYNKLANQFNNLETSMQLTSNKLQFIKEEDIKTKIIIEKIEYLDERLNDINNNFKMTFPEIIKKIFPIITHINIFSFIKKIETYKHFLIIDLQNVKNEIMFLTHKWNINENIMSQIDFKIKDFSKKNLRDSSLKNLNEDQISTSCEDKIIFLHDSNVSENEILEKEGESKLPNQRINLMDNEQRGFELLFLKDKIRLQNLLKIKDNIKIKLFHYKKIYEYIDEIFNEEIKSAESSSYWLYMVFFYKKNKNVKKDYDNPIVKELIRFAL